MKFCREKCIFLHPNEKQQTKDKEPHRCYLFNERIKHCGNHPRLITLRDCFFAKKTRF